MWFFYVVISSCPWTLKPCYTRNPLHAKETLTLNPKPQTLNQLTWIRKQPEPDAGDRVAMCVAALDAKASIMGGVGPTGVLRNRVP